MHGHVVPTFKKIRVEGECRSLLEWKPSHVLEGVDVMDKAGRGSGVHTNFVP